MSGIEHKENDVFQKYWELLAVYEKPLRRRILIKKIVDPLSSVIFAFIIIFVTVSIPYSDKAGVYKFINGTPALKSVISPAMDAFNKLLDLVFDSMLSQWSEEVSAIVTLPLLMVFMILSPFLISIITSCVISIIYKIVSKLTSRTMRGSETQKAKKLAEKARSLCRLSNGFAPAIQKTAKIATVALTGIYGVTLLIYNVKKEFDPNKMMEILGTIISVLFITGILALVFYAFFCFVLTLTSLCYRFYPKEKLSRTKLSVLERQTDALWVEYDSEEAEKREQKRKREKEEAARREKEAAERAKAAKEEEYKILKFKLEHPEFMEEMSTWVLDPWTGSLVPPPTPSYGGHDYERDGNVYGRPSPVDINNIDITGM